MTGLKRFQVVAGHPRSGVGRVGLLLLVVAGFGGIFGLFLLAGGNLGDLMRQIDENQGFGQGDGNGESERVEVPGIPGELLAEADPMFQDLAQKLGIAYQPPQRSVFRNRVTTECFEFQSVAGPFYCFADERLYLEMDFFDELTIRSSETAELAHAYVIGRLMGKHLQTRMGITDRVRQREFDLKPFERLKQQTQLELQADYFAGCWAHQSSRFRKLAKENSLDVAMKAIQAVTRDRLENCKDDGGIVAEKYDYATFEQRLKWFQLGLESGDPAEHDPFKVKTP